jgi:hypothetical protein
MPKDSGFKVTYQQEKGPPGISFEDYAIRLEHEYRDLIAADPTESDVQRFLEKNPSLVPGAWTPGTKSGHYPLHCALITQPILPGLTSRRPDFMWIATHSQSWFPTLIEIESPKKRMFMKSGLPTSAFTEARNQLAQWRTWFNDPANVQQFINSYGIPDEYQRFRTMRLHMILIYGKRTEFESNPALSKHRASLLPGHDEELMSFDRLSIDQALADAITIRAVGHGRFRVVGLPPMFSTGPIHAGRLLHIRGFSDAIDASQDILKDRGEFLKNRVAYWRKWASGPGSKCTRKPYRE